jgi:D-alanyl-lipoteichoic acid acyltransferase DltB (MBOAT superfamily)
MGITSLYFGLLSIVAIFVFYLLSPKYRIIYLAFLSCSFIATYSYYLLTYVVAYSLINYYIGIKIPLSRFKKSLFRTGIIINLSQLIILKYASFTIDPIFQIFNCNLNVSRLSEIIVPVGVSFFTLQGIGYLINIYIGWEKPEKNFIHFLLYIIFYPRFLSGPIERSNHFLPQLKVIQSFNEQRVTEGLRMVLFGFFKKVAIANQLAPFVNNTYENIGSADGYSLWILLFIQPLYLYFDFSGYTDIALGFAKTFGIELLPNFNRPFLSENMTNFWKRFHISLSSWFHDYVFKQTSFRYRKWGIFASVFAVFVTWTLFGIWHGAGWNFMLLGLLQALAINYEFFTKKWRVSLFSRLPGYYRVWLGRIFTYLFYSVSLVFFFSPNINSVILYFSRLIDVNDFMLKGIRREIFFLVLIFMIIFLVFEIIKNDFRDTYDKLEFSWMSNKKKYKLLRWALYFSIITIVIVLNSEVQQFIYFQF